jgi:hypothetical protein
MTIEQLRHQAAQGKRLLTTREIAARYGLGYSTLTKLRGAGGGSRYILIGRKVMYDEADFEAWLDSKRRTSTSQDHS